jgi:predicted  nucleic acid-binding Zn-ribbon protein
MLRDEIARLDRVIANLQALRAEKARALNEAQVQVVQSVNAQIQTLRDAMLDAFGINRQELKPFNIHRTAAQERWRSKKVEGKEVFDNLPALRGLKTQLSRALKALSRNSSLVWCELETDEIVED